MSVEGKVKTWVDTKDDLRKITWARPFVDVGVYENMSLYQWQVPNNHDDDNDQYIRVSDRSRGVWTKKTVFAASFNNSYAFNLLIGTTPVDVAFTTALGTQRSDYALVFTATKGEEKIEAIYITNEDQNGFTVSTIEDGVRFQGIAVRIN